MFVRQKQHVEYERMSTEKTTREREREVLFTQIKTEQIRWSYRYNWQCRISS